MWREKYVISLSNVVKLKSYVSRNNNAQVKYRLKSVLEHNPQVNVGILFLSSSDYRPVCVEWCLE